MRAPSNGTYPGQERRVQVKRLVPQSSERIAGSHSEFWAALQVMRSVIGFTCAGAGAGDGVGQSNGGKCGGRVSCRTAKGAPRGD